LTPTHVSVQSITDDKSVARAVNSHNTYPANYTVHGLER